MGKDKPKKTLEKRQQEVDNIMKQFLNLGFPIDHEGVQEFFKLVKDFEQNNISLSGTIKFPEFDRRMQYILSSQPHIESRVMLEYTGKKPPITRGSHLHKANNAHAAGSSFQNDARAL